jgi:hypothetical protein
VKMSRHVLSIVALLALAPMFANSTPVQFVLSTDADISDDDYRCVDQNSCDELTVDGPRFSGVYGVNHVSSTGIDLLSSLSDVHVRHSVPAVSCLNCHRDFSASAISTSWLSAGTLYLYATFPILLDNPNALGAFTLYDPNRIVTSARWEFFAGSDGLSTERLLWAIDIPPVGSDGFARDGYGGNAEVINPRLFAEFLGDGHITSRLSLTVSGAGRTGFGVDTFLVDEPPSSSMMALVLFFIGLAILSRKGIASSATRPRVNCA